MSKAAVQAIQDEKLLAAAAWLFRRKGFAATTLREIAQAAGMLLGSVHYRYSTKDALLLALMERGIEHAIAAVQTAAAQSTDPTERIRLGLRAHLLMLLSGDDAVYVLLYEWRALSGPARDEMVRLRDRYEAFWDGMLYEAAGAGRVRPGVDLKACPPLRVRCGELGRDLVHARRGAHARTDRGRVLGLSRARPARGRQTPRRRAGRAGRLLGAPDPARGGHEGVIVRWTFRELSRTLAC